MFHVRITGRIYSNEVKNITTLCGKKVSKDNTIPAFVVRNGTEKNYTSGGKVCKRCKKFALDGY